MCGGCGVAQQDWAGPILSSSHAKPLVARRLTGITPGLSVRATGVGWTVTQPGRPVTVHTSGVALLDQVSRWLASRGVLPEAVTAALEGTPEHREVRVSREMFPAARTARFAGGTGAFASRSEPVAPTRLIPALLGAALAARMSPTAVEHLVLRDAQECWTLQVS